MWETIKETNKVFPGVMLIFGIIAVGAGLFGGTMVLFVTGHPILGVLGACSATWYVCFIGTGIRLDKWG